MEEQQWEYLRVVLHVHLENVIQLLMRFNLVL